VVLRGKRKHYSLNSTSGNKCQALLLSRRFEQVFKSLSHNRFALAAADFFDDVQLLEVVVD
jgi:hypothetical protein